MKLECYPLDSLPFDITPADRRRDWMDSTENSWAYRCLPLVMANSHGWFLRCVESFDAIWHGGDGIDSVEIRPLVEGAELFSVQSHFGYGILTFRGRVVLRTSAGYNLWVMGPTNSFKDGLQPLHGLVETDWLPHPFTMNWKFTRPGVRIRFEVGEPYALIFPVRRGDVEATDPVFKSLKDEHDLERHVRDAWGLRRLGRFIGSRFGINKSEGWYMRGELPNRPGSAFADHQRSVVVKPFAKPVKDER